MSGFPNKVAVPSAIKERNNFPLDCSHETTSDFGLTQVSHFMPIVPTDKVNIDINSFAYLGSLISPTMGSCDLVQRAFFVPFDYICADWEYLISNKSYNSGSNTVPSLPLFSIENFMVIFHDYAYWEDPNYIPLVSADIERWISLNIPSTNGMFNRFLDVHECFVTQNASIPESTVGWYDYKHTWKVLESGVEVTYYVFWRLTTLGKQMYNLLIQLGYPAESIHTPASGSLDGASLLPIFALNKIFTDYYVDPRYSWDPLTLWYKVYTKSSDGFDSLAYDQQGALIHDMLSLCAYCWFSNDLFTSSWQSHEQPALNGIFKSVNISIPNSTSQSNVESGGTQDIDSRITTRVSSYGNTVITDTMLSMLKAVSSFFKRNNIAGTRPIDTLFARFGVHMPEIVAKRAQYLGSNRVPLRISDLIAQSAGTDGSGNTSILGERAGQGFIGQRGNNFHISFENKYYYGYLIVVSHIIPKTMYYQGGKPHIYQTSLFDFFTPEFEEIGAEPIPNKVLYADQQLPDYDASGLTGYLRNSIFGYGPRYYAYKFGFDTLSGDFRLKRYYNSLRSYQMFRELTDPDNPQYNDLKNNSAFRQWSDKARSFYDKMFVSQDIKDDHFVINYNISVTANRPMRGIGVSLLGKIEGGKHSLGLRPNGKYF